MTNLKKICYSAIFLATGFILPLFTSQIKEIGDTLLPMHLPIMLCGLICGGGYAAIAGFILPLLRGAVFSMPPIYPNALWMAFELSAYGAVIGFLYGKKEKKSTAHLYFCLISAMISGRIVWGIAKTVLLGIGGKAFTFYAFLAGGFIDSLPGIVLQLILIPAIMSIVNTKKNKEV